MTQLTNNNLEASFVHLQQSLRNYLRMRIPDASQVDDLLQDIFVKALLSERAGKTVDNLAGWLFAVARSTLIDHLRAKGLSTEELDENIPEEDVENLQLHAEISNCLIPFIAELPPIYRDTLLATDIEGSTLNTYAKTQALSISAIKSRVVRGRAMLKEKLQACCDITMKDGVVSDYQSHSENCCGD